LKKKIVGRQSQEAWGKDELNGVEPPFVKQISLSLS
jgi:hypothetical protein